MPRLSACIEMLFGEEPSFYRRIELAAEAGLPLVEFWRWREKDLGELKDALAASGVGVKSFLSEPEGPLVDPGARSDFVAGVEESARVARELGAEALIVLSGEAIVGVEVGQQREAIVAALRAAAPIAAEQGLTLLLEPLNSRVDHPGTFLDSTGPGLDLVEAVDSQNVRLLLDLYHAVTMGEAPADVVGDRQELIGHVHVADAPGRHEPGTGSIDWTSVLAWFERVGYGGDIGLEYLPSGPRTVDSLELIGAEIASWR